jgi:copper chaperone CopZ
MEKRSVFDIDCNSVIPECEFECPKCIEEIESTLIGVDGIGRVYLDDEENEAKLIVEHDPAIVSVEKIIDILKTLPSFYEGFFVPIFMENDK